MPVSILSRKEAGTLTPNCLVEGFEFMILCIDDILERIK